MSLSKGPSISAALDRPSSSIKKRPEPPNKKQKLLLTLANRTEKYLLPNQPGRVHLDKIGFYKRNRGGQGVLPLHSHDVCTDICTKGTSKRRYGIVRLVQVPDAARADWLATNQTKAKMNPWLPEFQAMSHTGPVYANLNSTHFVSAQQLIKEGGRKFRDEPDGFFF